MAVIQNLDINLRARTKGLNKGFKSARRSIGGFAKSFLGFGLGFTAITLGIRAAISRIDELAKTSRKLGVATKELSGLRFAAQLAGVEVRTFDMGLQRFVRRLSEAAINTGEAQGAFRELGLDAKRLNKLTPTDALLETADALRAVKNQSDRVRLAFKLFDSEGVALINMLSRGSGALREALKEAEELGITLDEFQTGQVEAASDAMLRVNSSFQGLANIATVKLAPSLVLVADGFTQMIKGMNDTQKSSKDTLSALETLQVGSISLAEQMSHANDIMVVSLLQTTEALFGLSRSAKDSLSKYEQSLRHWEKRQVGWGESAINEFNKVKEAQAALDSDLPTDALGGAATPTPGALEKGTVGAFSAANRAGAGNLSKVAKNTATSVVQAKVMINVLKQMVAIQQPAIAPAPIP